MMESKNNKDYFFLFLRRVFPMHFHQKAVQLLNRAFSYIFQRCDFIFGLLNAVLPRQSEQGYTINQGDQCAS